MGGTGKVAGHPGDEVETHGHHNKSDDERAEHVAVGVRQNHDKYVEHASQRSQRQELVAGKDNGKNESHRD